MPEVHGALLNGICAAGNSIRLLLHSHFAGCFEYRPDEWYPAAELQSLLRQCGRYRNPAAVIERLGEQMMVAWYEQGPGRGVAPRGLDFIRIQAGSEGYGRVVRGAAEEVGAFALESLDEVRGRATIRSTTVFDRALELGVLHGGLNSAGDLLYFDIALRGGEYFDLRFVSAGNRETLSWAEVLPESEWRWRHQVRQFERREAFWVSINDTLNEAFAEMRQRAALDALTGVYARGEFFRRLEIEYERVKRHATPLSILYMDLDRFKAINDCYGHAAGDTVIQAFARTCQRAVRTSDILGRLGGEEFALVLWNAGLAEAKAVAQRILRDVRAIRLVHGKAEFGFTASIGVAELRAHQSIGNFIDQADRCLLAAKNGGRDRVCA